MNITSLNAYRYSHLTDEEIWAEVYLRAQVNALLEEVTREAFERRIAAFEAMEAIRDYDR